VLGGEVAELFHAGEQTPDGAAHPAFAGRFHRT
jgi:hypothetical protein